ncbi:hypothetical protein HZ995_09145 [Cognatishimia activa]|uniref:Uncharacterized protein n=2 Tax=Cognatishimia activa TaxID=1715691 RepID=A0A975I7B5_9RHOB|nr:hypothetical protein HZ995_09145 [Cognatishimia activa]
MPKPGKETRGEHFTKLVRNMMEEPAWRALSTSAQALYPWVKLEWRGPKHNNNGKIELSVRQAAERIGVADNTAMNAFHDLQAKGFLVLRKMGSLGVHGTPKTPEYEITELPLPHSPNITGRKLYREWANGQDFPVLKARANNPSGKNGKAKTHLQIEDDAIVELKTFTNSASQKRR